MEPQAPKPKRISGDEKRKRDIENLTNKASQYNELHQSTKRDYLTARANVARAQQAIENAKRVLIAQKKIMQETTNLYCREMTKIAQTKSALNRLLSVDDLKTRTKVQKKEQSVQKYHDTRGGQRFDISSLDKLPLDVVLYIGEFLTRNVRTKYLEDVYNPSPIFNKLRVNVKRDFITLAILNKKYFSHLTKNEINDAETKINFARHNTINDEVSALIHTAKQVNPEGAHKLIKSMCILFKKNKKYKENWNAFCVERTRLKNIAN
jgi:hypothetical protein